MKQKIFCVLICLCVWLQAFAQQFKGEPITLNFQDIAVRSVLQKIGDYTQQNIVISEGVTGTITLRLHDVPWDQALDIILQTKGLGMQVVDDIMFIAPHAEMAEQRRQSYEIDHVEAVLAPLQQRLIKLQYARARDIERIIEDNSRNDRAGKSNKVSTDGLLSSRGRISVDERTNTVIINDIPLGIQKVVQLVHRLDVPVRQVLINARIVVASQSFARELGVRWGGGVATEVAGVGIGVAGTGAGAEVMASGAVPSLSQRLGVNLAAMAANSTLGMSLLGKDFLLDLELSAMQDEGRGEVISSPRVIAQDGGEASIKQSTKIAYDSVDTTGRVSTTWHDVPLSLHVQPTIAPNRRIDMALEITKDSLGHAYNGRRSVDSNSVVTQVLVDDGETVVLGGVYEQMTTNSERKVPLLGDLPLIGAAFRHTKESIVKRELLIFVTPTIIERSEQ